eukprot:264979_1
MAQAIDETTTDSSTTDYKLEDLYDVEKEETLLKSFIEVALSHQDETWTKANTKDPNLFIDYKFLPNDSLCTVRGQTAIPNASVDKFYDFAEPGYDDYYAWGKSCDKMCTESTCIQSIDINHDVVYGSYDSGVWTVSPRDFCYMQVRSKWTDYKASDGNTYDIACTLCYSVDETYPFYRGVKAKHVRGELKYGGYVFINLKDNNGTMDTSGCKVCYVVYLDPKGWIPSWVVNLVAPDQGMVVKGLLENWPKVEWLMQQRKNNGYKRSREI